jgi:hypothetical protein
MGQVSKAFKIKPTDNAKEVAREARRKNRLNSIRNELEAGRISSFEQIFAIISETRMSTELDISFYAFRKKVQDPGEFTVNEMMRLAALFGVKYDVVATFILDRIKAKSKSKIFRE